MQNKDHIVKKYTSTNWGSKEREANLISSVYSFTEKKKALFVYIAEKKIPDPSTSSQLHVQSSQQFFY